MQMHNSTCLDGPVSKARAWWKQFNLSAKGENPLPEKLPEHAQDDDPAFRADLVARIRRQIADGTYGTEEQWNIAFDRMLDHLESMDT